MNICRRSKALCLLFAVCALLLLSSTGVSAAQTGFVTQNGKTYYIQANGKKLKGWLELDGKKYYFDEKTGVQVKGWQKDASGNLLRYFTSGQGCMVTGFLTDTSGKTRYFNPETGLLTFGWMKNKDGDTYYFKSKTGIMAKGWLTNSKGQKRYMSKATGKMCVGWVKDSNGKYRYFNKNTGYLYTGLRKVGKYRYYFAGTYGTRYQGGLRKVSSKRYYFSPSNGRAQTGWITVDGKKYYGDAEGVLQTSTVITIDGTRYQFDSKGVATKVPDTDYKDYEIAGSYVKVFDKNNNRSYYLQKQYASHPGIADGKLSDLDILAAVCDSEAGDQGLVGMEAVALCVLNRTIDANREFPSEIRYVVYQSNPLQYAVVTDGALLRRLNGQFENRTNAYKAAQNAITIFQNYRLKGTSRTLSGFKKKDFDYKYFMMESTFWNQGLSFSKLDYEIYKDHAFFTDWI